MGTWSVKAAYVDASALVKLFKTEPESGALLERLSEYEVWVSSELVVVEARCTAWKLDGEKEIERSDEVVDGLDLVSFNSDIRERAGDVFTPALRALDAIHLATALSISEDVGSFFAYDRELCAAASREGLLVVSPGVDATDDADVTDSPTEDSDS